MSVFVGNKLRAYNECPLCGRKGVWRTGVGFENQLRCSDCNHSFDPAELWQQQETERLSFNTFRE